MSCLQVVGLHEPPSSTTFDKHQCTHFSSPVLWLHHSVSSKLRSNYTAACNRSINPDKHMFCASEISWTEDSPQIRSHDFWHYINLYVCMLASKQTIRSALLSHTASSEAISSPYSSTLQDYSKHHGKKLVCPQQVFNNMNQSKCLVSNSALSEQSQHDCLWNETMMMIMMVLIMITTTTAMTENNRYYLANRWLLTIKIIAHLEIWQPDLKHQQNI